MSLTYLLRVKLQLRPTRQRHENRLYMTHNFNPYFVIYLISRIKYISRRMTAIMWSLIRSWMPTQKNSAQKQRVPPALQLTNVGMKVLLDTQTQSHIFHFQLKEPFCLNTANISTYVSIRRLVTILVTDFTNPSNLTFDPPIFQQIDKRQIISKNS